MTRRCSHAYHRAQRGPLESPLGAEPGDREWPDEPCEIDRDYASDLRSSGCTPILGPDFGDFADHLIVELRSRGMTLDDFARQAGEGLANGRDRFETNRAIEEVARERPRDDRLRAQRAAYAKRERRRARNFSTWERRFGTT